MSEATNPEAPTGEAGAPQALDAPAGPSPGDAGVHPVGYVGTSPDTTPREAYTVAGVTRGLDPPAPPSTPPD